MKNLFLVLGLFFVSTFFLGCVNETKQELEDANKEIAELRDAQQEDNREIYKLNADLNIAKSENDALDAKLQLYIINDSLRSITLDSLRQYGDQLAQKKADVIISKYGDSIAEKRFKSLVEKHKANGTFLAKKYDVINNAHYIVIEVAFGPRIDTLAFGAPSALKYNLSEWGAEVYFVDPNGKTHRVFKTQAPVNVLEQR